MNAAIRVLSENADRKITIYWGCEVYQENRDTDSSASFAPAEIGIVIKALNEERNIARAIESALAAAPGHSVCVVLADSGSEDATVEIARRYPIDIVQLADRREKSCGIGAQLGFQHMRCQYVYILDGDMEIFPAFILQAIKIMANDNGIAGVAGLVEERGGGNYEFERRKQLNDGLGTGEVDWLDMGGLYRTDYVRAVGYLTNRSLHSYEEKELAFRLRQCGHRLYRLAQPAVRHYGKTDSTARLLWQRWKSRHLDGQGEVLRATFGTPSFQFATRLFRRNILVAATITALPVAVLLLLWSAVPLALVCGFHFALFGYFFLRSRQVRIAGTAYVNSVLMAVALLRGVLRPQVDPIKPIRSVVLQHRPSLSTEITGRN